MSRIEIKKKPQTDLVVEKFYQDLGAYLSKILKNTTLSPNEVTLLKIPVAILILTSLISQALPTAAFLIIFWKILDKLDGAIARQRGKTSKIGAWLDLAIDRFVWGAMLFGIAIASAKINQNTLPYLLLSLIFFLNIIFQNLSFLNKNQNLNWYAKKTSFKSKFILFKIPLVYQTVFSFYYLFDQFAALALLLQKPILQSLKIDSLLILLMLYTLFFAISCVYVIFSQYLLLNSKRAPK